MLKQLKTELAAEQIKQFFEKMKQLGFEDSETLALVKKAVKEEV